MVIVEDQAEVQVETPVEEVGEVNQEVQVSMEEGLVHMVEDQTEKEVMEEILVGIQEVLVGIDQEVKVHTEENRVLGGLQIKEEIVLEILDVGEDSFLYCFKKFRTFIINQSFIQF